MSEGQVRLLGPVRFVDGEGDVVDLPSATQRRLLAVLAVAAGTTLRPDHLADVLETSPGALRTAVSRLRARVGEGTIRTDSDGYRLAGQVDAAEATRLIAGAGGDGDRLSALEQALALWEGDALDEFRHEPWAEAEVARLDGLRAVAVEDRAEELIVRGRAAEAVVALETHIVRQPRRDRPRALLIQALAADGRQADALQAYQDYRTFLIEETGTEPSAAVRAIEQRVAAGWSGPGDLPLEAVLATGSSLIGRRDELAVLESAFTVARGGSTAMVLLSGEPGIGKTTLLAAFARAHHRPGDAIVLYGRCADGASVPLQPFRTIVATVVEHATEGLLADHVDRHGGDLLRIAPSLATRLRVPAPSTGDDATERFQLFEAVADLLRRVAGRSTVVLALDDLHWAEPTALLLLRHLSRALVDEPLLLALSWRDEETSEPLRAALADLDRAGAHRVPLAGFDDVELADLVASITGRADPELFGALRAETAGNPLYAGHLVRHRMESGGDLVPPSLRDVLWSRVATLGDGPAEVLRTAAVLGIEFSERLVVELVDVDEREVIAGLDAAVDAGLLDGGPDTFRFTHGLIARALDEELGGSQRRRRHERVAMILEDKSDPTSLGDVVQVARHWELAGDLAASLRWAKLAGDLALEHLAAAEAASWYGRALDHARSLDRPEAEEAELLVRLGIAQRRAGDPAARATVVEAGALAERAGADDVLVLAALANEHTVVRLGVADEDVLSLVEAALAVVDRDDTPTYATLLAIHALQLVPTPHAELRQKVAREAIDLVEQTADATVLPRMTSALQFALWGPGALPLRRQLADRAVAAADAADDPFLRFWTTRAAYYVAVESADAAASRLALGRLRALADDVGEPALQWVVGITETFDLTMRARFDEADRLLEQMLELGLRTGEPDAFQFYAGQLFVIRSFAGRYQELIPVLEEVMAANPGMLPFRLAHAISCSAVGRRDEARAVLDAGAAGGLARVPADYLWMTTVIGYAVLTVELEASNLAAELYALLEPYGEEVAFNGATSQGHIGAYLGKLASLRGDHDLADEHLHRALEVNLAFGWEYHEATTLVALAQSRLRRTGVGDDEVPGWLDRADAIAGERGLTLVTTQVARLRTGDAHL